MRKFITAKKRGFILFAAVLSSLVFMFMTGAFFHLYGGQFSYIQNGRTAIQAQQYAEIGANTVSLLSYNSLDTDGAHARKAITGVSGWEDEVIIGSETTYENNNKQRIATINVYKTGDSQPRWSLQKPLSSQGSVSGVPSGTIVIWSGSVSTIPAGWHLADGTNGTPDLRSRFVYGAGSTNTKTSYGVGWNVLNGHWPVGVTGGEEFHRLSIAEMPSHNHSYLRGNQVGGGNWNFADFNTGFVWDYTGYAGGDQAHNTLPPFVTLAYIMKL